MVRPMPGSMGCSCTAIVESKGIHAPDYSQPLYVRTDACAQGLGAYLFQIVEEEQKKGDSTVMVKTERVIEYWSKSVPKAFRQYDTRKLELLAVILALEYFKPVIDGVTVKLDTDHRNLTFLENVKHSTRQLARWAMRLSELNYELRYRPGKLMQVADCLSRNALPEEVSQEQMDQIMYTASFNEIEPRCFSVTFHKMGADILVGEESDSRCNDWKFCPVTLAGPTADVDTEELPEGELKLMSKAADIISREEIGRAQRDDQKIEKEMFHGSDRERKRLLARYKFDGQLLFTHQNGQDKRVYVPASLRKKLMYLVHDSEFNMVEIRLCMTSD